MTSTLYGIHRQTFLSKGHNLRNDFYPRENRRTAFNSPLENSNVHLRGMRVVRFKSLRCLRFFFTVRLLSVRNEHA